MTAVPCHVEAVVTRREHGFVLTDLLVNGESISARVVPDPVLHVPAESDVERVELSLYVDQITVVEAEAS